MGWLAAAWEWASTNGAGLGGVAAVVTGAVAVAALLVAARDSTERSRPMVVAELRDALRADAIQYLVIKNLGPSVARKVRVLFDPPLSEMDDSESRLAAFIQRRYSKPIPALVPGQELDNIWFSGRPDAAKGWVNSEPLPDTFTVRIRYHGVRRRRYEERFDLDVGLIRQRTYATSSKDPEEQMKVVIKHLESIDASLRELAQWSGDQRTH